MSGLEIMNLIVTYATLLNFNPQIAVSVAKVESNLNPNAIGTKGEIGLFQIMPQYHKMLSKEELKNIHTNIIVGITMLRDVKNKCVHKKELTWLTCYNMGYSGAKRLKNPKDFSYVKKVRKEFYNYKIIEYAFDYKS